MSIDIAVLLIGPNSGKRILGMSVVLRDVLTTHRAGSVKRFILVGNSPEDESLAAAVIADARVLQRKIDVSYVRASEAAGRLAALEGGRFWLVDGECVFTDALIARTAEATGGAEETVFVAPEWSDGRPGVALAASALVGRLTSALSVPATGDAGLRLDVRELCAGLKCVGKDAAGLLVRVDGRSGKKRAEKVLIQTGRKPVDGLISRNFNRRISLFFTRRFLKIGAKPAVLSLGTFCIGITGAWLASRGSGYWTFAAAGLLFEFASIFDGCDGEVSRLTFSSSEKGALLDVTVDAITYVAFFICLPVGLYKHTGRPVYLALLGVMVLGMALYYLNLSILTRKTGIKADIVRVSKEIEARPKMGKVPWYDVVASKLTFLFRRDFFATAVCLAMLVGGSGPLYFAVAGIALIEGLYVFSYTMRAPRKSA